MTTKLEAINTMLSCIGQAPLNTLDGMKSYFTIAAENILEDEVKRVQLKGYDFNTESDYQLNPNTKNEILIPDNMIQVKLPTLYLNRYVVRKQKIYDKYNHTFKIYEPLRATVVFKFEFEDLPEVARDYIKMTAANKFVKRELGSQAPVAYTQEDMIEALITMEQHELEIGQYTLISEYYTREIRDSL